MTRDIVRDIVIPEDHARPEAVVLCKPELDKIVCSGEVEGLDRIAEAKKNLDKLEEQLAQSELRKRELRKFDTYKDLGPRLQELEHAAKHKANALLQKAKEVRQEDEDDIKLCNKLLLETKCQAIRDAQILERKQIEKELEEEEKRLNAIMEQERRRKLAREEEDKLREMKKRQEYVYSLNEQVKRNVLEREMEAEKQLEESMIMKEAAKKAEIEQVRQEEARRMRQEMVRMDINKLNDQILTIAEEEKEKSKLADLKIQELMRKKAEEERENEERIKEEKRQREIELARMRAAQQKSSDDQERRDAERAKRIQEQCEKQWMQKERQAALDKIAALAKLKEERRLQIEEKQRQQAEEREKELKEVARLQLMEEAMRKRELEEQEQRRLERDEYKAQLLKQINEKEKEKINERKKFFEEGLTNRVAALDYDQSLRMIMKRKVAEIKTHNIPEKYVFEVEKKLQTKTSTGYD